MHYSLFYRSLSIFSMLRPLLIISNPERLQSVNFTTFSTFYDLFIYNFISAPSSLPRIIEISNYPYLTSIFSNSTFSNHHINFIPVCVTDFTQEKAKEILPRVFKPLQLSTLFHEFGGHGASFVKVHELMRDGFSFDASVKRVLYSYQQKLKQAPLSEIITLVKGDKVTYDQIPVLVDTGIAGPIDLSYMGFSNNAYANFAKKLIKSHEKSSTINIDNTDNTNNVDNTNNIDNTNNAINETIDNNSTKIQ